MSDDKVTTPGANIEKQMFLARQKGELNIAVQSVCKRLRLNGSSKSVKRPSPEFVPNGTHILCYMVEDKRHAYQVIVSSSGATVSRIFPPV